MKIQKDRLVDEFTSAITAYQTVQRKTIDLEKNAVRLARQQNQANIKPPNSGANNSNSGSYNGNNPSSLFEDNFVSNKQVSNIQMQEEIDLQALEEQESTIRELEVNYSYWNRVRFE